MTMQSDFSAAAPIMLNIGLIFTALAELSTRQIAETVQASGMTENAQAGKKGGGKKKGGPKKGKKRR